MFIIELTYAAPLEAVDDLLPAHVEFLEEEYAKGTFLASGRKVPRTGGIILARSDSPEALWAVLDRDPFRTADVARYEITEFVPTMTADALACLREESR